MKNAPHGPDRYRIGFPPRMAALLVTALLILTTMICARSSQAAPLAGTSIGNQASATYTDASAVTRTATSNTVQTIVQQVAGLTITATQTKIGAPGGTIYFPHTITNTGNGSDSYTLGDSPGSGVFTFGAISIYADLNSDGVPDNFTPITSSGPLAPGASFKFVVAATLPPAAGDGQSNTITIAATSVFNTATTQSNTDTAQVSGKAIIAMTKAVSPSSGNPGSGPLTYTLTYTNTGNSTATALKITDPIPSGLTYNPGNKARWSVTTSTALTDLAVDTQGSAPNTIIYDYGVSTAGTVTATIAQVLPGESRTLTFEVMVDAAAAPGSIGNKADFSYDDGSGSTKTGSTNTTPFTVNQSGGVVANGSSSSNVDGTAEPITVAAVPQGSTVSFTVYIWNTGNGTDSFDITLPVNNFPAGTSLVLYKADGLTPLVDTNSNSTPDTGPLAPGASYKIVVKAILPAGAISAVPVSATLTATSKQDSAKSNSAIFTLSGITANTVDLTLATARTDSSPAGTAATGNAASTGFGPGPEAAALTPHKSANPGTTTSFALKVNNTSPNADTYNLAASPDSTFASTTLPAGWTVTFNADGGAGNCSTTGAIITNTGIINLGVNATVCASVSVPAGASAGTQEISFRALSPSSGAVDTIRCAIDVNSIRAITVTTNQTQQIFPGGTAVYPMTVTNSGNVTEGTVPTSGTPDGTGTSKVVLGISDSLAAQGWNSLVYFDANDNGLIDAGDPVVTDLSFVSGSAAGLSPGESVKLLVKVFAPAGATVGVFDVTTLTATTTGLINGAAAPAASSATAASTVVSGQVTLVKTQALDATCNGAADTAYGQSTISSGAIPGACILYKVTATNVGTTAVTNLVVSDATPSNTVYNAGTQCPTTGGTFVAATTSGTISAPAQCTAGTISATIAALNPGSSVDITFGVQINR